MPLILSAILSALLSTDIQSSCRYLVTNSENLLKHLECIQEV